MGDAASELDIGDSIAAARIAGAAIIIAAIVPLRSENNGCMR